MATYPSITQNPNDDARDASLEQQLQARMEMARGLTNDIDQTEMSPEMDEAAKHSLADMFGAELNGDEPTPGVPDAEAMEYMRQLVLSSLGSDLQRRAEERVNQRRPVEDRWLEDLRQYHSKYDPKLLQEIIDAKGSQVFVNITAPKTDGFAARMADMILPTDGKNWAIKNTPIPEVLAAMNDSSPLLDPTGQQYHTADGHPVELRDVASGINDALDARCKAMEDEMDDQLTECNYNAVQRRGIDQVAQLGTMVLKGPNIVGRSKRVWQRQQDATGTVHVCQIVEDKRPAAEWVDVWDFFPDLNSPDPEGWEDVFQRHYMTKRQLRELAKQPGFDENAIRTVLKEDRKPFTTSLHLQMLRDITGEHQTLQPMSRYELWEYHGPVTCEQLAACGVDLPDDEDPLAVLDAVIWFCEGTVVKAIPTPEEQQGLGYHVTWVRKDETSPFGFGIPRLMRNSQKVANAAWRMVMDNAGLSLAPQIIMAMGVVPADGNYSLYPGKVWIAKEGVIDVRAAMETFEIEIQLKDLLTIFETAMKLADDETSAPIIMQGENTPAVPETAEGMSMLFNAASVIQRRFVRLYDDRITVPIITGLYDWNMAYNPNEDIKGDYSTVALGSSALLEKERQTQNILAGLNLAASPAVAPHVDIHGLVEDAYKALRLGNRVLDRKKAEANMQQQAQAAQAQQQAILNAKKPAQPDPAVAQQELALEQNDQQLRAREIALKETQHSDDIHLAVMKLAQATGLSREKLAASLALTKTVQDSENQRFNAEARIKATDGTGL